MDNLVKSCLELHCQLLWRVKQATTLVNSHYYLNQLKQDNIPAHESEDSRDHGMYPEWIELKWI